MYQAFQYRLLKGMALQVILLLFSILILKSERFGISALQLNGTEGREFQQKPLEGLRKEIVNCKISEQSHFEGPKFTEISKSTIFAFVWSTLVGDNFTYGCCDNGTNSSIYRFGLYEASSVDPVKLLCRVEVNQAATVGCKVQWGSNFNNSRYHDRVVVEYNSTANCIRFSIRDIKYGDENIFISSKRDDTDAYFRLCLPATLNITKGLPTSRQTPSTKNTPRLPTSRPTPSTKNMHKGLTKAMDGWMFEFIPVGGIAVIFFIILIASRLKKSSQKRQALKASTRRCTLIADGPTRQADYGSISSCQGENFAIPMQEISDDVFEQHEPQLDGLQ